MAAVKIRALARRLAVENRRQASVLTHQAKDEMALARLQPCREQSTAYMAAKMKIDKARRLMRIAARFEKVDQNGTGPGADPGPVVTFRRLQSGRQG